jgi:hypothetical protein
MTVLQGQMRGSVTAAVFSGQFSGPRAAGRDYDGLLGIEAAPVRFVKE